MKSPIPHAASFLMDRETLLAHRLHWGEEPEPARQDLSRLTAQETAVYDDLRFDRLQPGLRLEQERVGFGWLSERLFEGASCLPRIDDGNPGGEGQSAARGTPSGWVA